MFILIRTSEIIQYCKLSLHISLIKHDLLPIECAGEMFGQNCKKSCGKCLNNEQCHHINGSCLNGCNPGYHGINCIERIYILLMQA